MNGLKRYVQATSLTEQRKSRSMSDLGPLKGSRSQRGWFRANFNRLSFTAFVILPTLFAIIFYGSIAAPRYVSEVRFIVRSLTAPKIGGFDMLFRTIGIAKTADDAYVIQRYLLSRDALVGLQQEGVDLKAMFAVQNADWFSRYPRPWRRDSIEALYDYYLDHVPVTEDSVKGILTLQAVTFRAEDSRKLATTVLNLAEEMVNRMNDRAQTDSVSTAVNEVKKAEADVIDVQAQISSFRDKEITIDPSKASVSVLDTVTTLSTDLAYAAANLHELRAASPNSPSIPAVVAKISSLEDRIKTERAKLAGNDTALSNKIAVYEQLALRRDLADKSLASALTSLEEARQEARRQHIYIEDVVSPNLPDESTEPERLRGIATVMVFGFALFAVTWILSVGAGEHSQ